MDNSGNQSKLEKSNQLYKKYKKNPATEKISEFKKYKRQLDKILRMLKSDYYDITIEGAGTDSKKI